MRYLNNPGYIIGFHGCDRNLGEQVLAGKRPLEASKNDYDWLGHGIYFWESDPLRASEWSHDRMSHPNSSIEEPFVLGAVIDLKSCLALMQRKYVEMVEEAYCSLLAAKEAKGESLPENIGGDDKFKRHLDCAVIQTLHGIRKKRGMTEFDSVRGLFMEGDEPYPKAGFKKKNHIQICVRNPACIQAYFRPLG